MVSKYFEAFPYKLNEKKGIKDYLLLGIIDYDDLEEIAIRYRPKILIAGVSAYSRLIDYSRMK